MKNEVRIEWSCESSTAVHSCIITALLRAHVTFRVTWRDAALSGESVIKSVLWSKSNAAHLVSSLYSQSSAYANIVI